MNRKFVFWGTVVTQPYPAWSGWSLGDYIAAAGMVTFGLVTNVNTVLNNAYSFGSTLYDSGFFQTIIWRSGWMLKPAPTIDDVSFLNVHLSPINYLPSAVSYLLPIDRMTYYGLVYGVVFGLLLLVTFMILRQQYGGRKLPAIIGSLLLYLSGPINNGQWEPHQEYASSLFMLWFFLMKGERRPYLAILMIVLNAAVREDCGLLLALPLLLLAVHRRWSGGERDGETNSDSTLAFAAISITMSVVSFTIKLIFFNLRDATRTFYYGSPPFGHLSVSLLERRLFDTVSGASYLWLPGLVLLVAAVWRRDSRLMFGWVAFFPYWLFNFLSIGDLNAVLGSYKAFPLVITLLWPAIMAMERQRTDGRALGIIQLLVLISSSISWSDGSLYLGAPSGLTGLVNRWALHPETENAERYRAIESRLGGGGLGDVRASEAVLALYPYSFPIYYRSQVIAGAEEQAEKLDSLLWFAGDRDEPVTEKWLSRGHFPYLYHVIGTRISLATRLPPEKLPAFAGMLELAVAK